MRFYDQQHEFYCGVDLHVKRMYLCVLDRDGNKRLHRNLRTKPQEFLREVESFREDLVVGAECMFTWYWLADLCLDEGIKFILGPRGHRDALRVILVLPDSVLEVLNARESLLGFGRHRFERDVE